MNNNEILSVTGQVKALIYEILEDGETHTIKQFKESIYKKNIDVSDVNTTIRNALRDMMDKDKNILRISRGVYYLNKPNERQKNVTELQDYHISVSSESSRQLNYDNNDYVLIEPSARKKKRMVLSITKDGWIFFNQPLLTAINQSEVEIRVKKDGSSMILNLEGEVKCKITKSGRSKNYQLVDFLHERKFTLPVYYDFEWDPDKNRFYGKLTYQNPNSSLRNRQKHDIDTATIVK